MQWSWKRALTVLDDKAELSAIIVVEGMGYRSAGETHAQQESCLQPCRSPSLLLLQIALVPLCLQRMRTSCKQLGR